MIWEKAFSVPTYNLLKTQTVCGVCEAVQYHLCDCLSRTSSVGSTLFPPFDRSDLSVFRVSKLGKGMVAMGKVGPTQNILACVRWNCGRN